MVIDDILKMHINNCKAAMTLLKERFTQLESNHPESDAIKVAHYEIDKCLRDLMQLQDAMSEGQI